jgi:hypothetical protein
MATTRKAKSKSKAKGKAKRKKTRVATRGGTVRKAKTIPKKIANKAPTRAASPKKATSTGQGAAKPAPMRERAPAAALPHRPAQPVASEQRIGVVTHYYGQLSVVAIQLEPSTTLRVGDVVHIQGHTTDFTQRVESLEVNHGSVLEVKPTDDFGLKVIEHAREHDVVFKVRR